MKRARRMSIAGRTGALLLALVVLLAAAAPAFSDDEGSGGGGGGGEAQGEGGSEGEGEAEGEAEGEGEAPAVRTPSGRFRRGGGVGLAAGPGFHPTYKLTHEVDQDVSAWGHNFNMAYPLTGRIAFRASSAITIRETAALNRTNRQETWNAGLDIGVTDALTTGLSFTRTTQEDVRNAGAANEVRSSHERESVSAETSYKKTLLSSIDLSLGASGGLETNNYSNVRSRGAVQSVNASLRYKAPLGLGTGFTYTGNHSLLDSEQGSLKSTDESVSHNIGANVDYKWLENTFAVDVGRMTATKQYPKEEQTEERNSDTESVDVSADLALVEGLSTKLTLSHGRNREAYLLEPTKNNDIKTRGVSASLAYRLGASSFSAELGSERRRNEYYSTETGRSYSNSIGATVGHEFGPRLKASVRGRMGLFSHHYDNIIANDQDRDLFDREATFQLDYTPRPDVRTALSFRIREDELIYIRTTRTANNKVAQTYSLQPSITKEFSPRVTVTQKYELSADYTFYTYNEDANFLIRNFAVTTGIGWEPFDPLRLSLEHKYRAQDEGAYLKDASGVEAYGRNSERSDNSMKVGVKYTVWGALDIEAAQEFSFQRKWNYDEGVREFAWERFDTALSGKAGMDYELKDGSKLKLSVGRTHRDATAIIDRQREVWNIALSIDRTF